MQQSQQTVMLLRRGCGRNGFSLFRGEYAFAGQQPDQRIGTGVGGRRRIGRKHGEGGEQDEEKKDG